MRKLLATLALLCVASTSSAQVVPLGATPETVVRTLGAPRARSAAKNREIWLYPKYQVVFENGRMTSLLGLPTDGGGEVKWQKSAAETAAVAPTAQAVVAEGRPAPAPVAAAGSGMAKAASATSPTPSSPAKQNATPTPSTSSTPPAPAAVPKASVVPSLATQEAGKAVLRAPEKNRAPLPAPPVPLGTRIWRVLWPLLASAALGALGLGIAVWRWRVRQRRRAAEAVRRAEAARAAEVAAAEHRNAVAAAEGKAPSLVDWELTPELLREVEWKRFELLVQRYYEAAGFRTKAAGTGADDGVDIYLFRAGAERPCSGVQCKAWGARRVDVKRVRELFGVMAAQGVPEGVFATTSDFTPDARVFGRQNRMTLFSGAEFIIVFNRLPPMVRERILREVTEGDFTTPSCPRCGVKLTRRVNSEDQSEFWGCARYPRCHYTMKMRGELAEAEVAHQS